MRKQISLKEAIEKKLTNFAESPYKSTWILTFDDDAFVALTAGGWGEDTEIEEDEDFNPFEFGDKQVIDLGILPADKVKEVRDKELEKHKIRIEKADRAEYERLKAKYEG